MSADLLLPFLEMAVPLEMHRMRALDQHALQRIAQDSAQTVAERGDVIQFRARGTATATAALIRGLAAAALVSDGGVTFAGRHWCLDHSRCIASGAAS